MAFWDSWFGGDDDNGYDQAAEYLNKIQPMLEQSYNPYMQQGQNAGTALEQQYNMLLNNPAAIQAMLGSQYTQSPGYQYNFDQAMAGQNSAAAAGGMAGGSAHQQNAARTATGLSGQDYWKYMGANQGLYNQGLAGMGNMYNTGFNATNQYTGGMGNLYGSQANLAMAEQQSGDDIWASLLGLAGGAGGAFLGGPGGAAAGAGIGNMFGSLFDKGGGSSGSYDWGGYNYTQPSWIDSSVGTMPIGG